MGQQNEDYLERQRRRYANARGKEKTGLIDEVVAATGYHRKSVIRLLRRPPRTEKGDPRGRPRTYGPDVAMVAGVLWEAHGRIGGRLIHANVSEMLGKLDACGELAWLEPETRRLVQAASPATLDRLLKAARHADQRRRWRRIVRSDAVSHLRKQIAVKTFADWDDTQPGFLEVDLVHHSGDSAAGFFLCTLTAVDVATGWVELQAVWGKQQQAVVGAIDAVRQRLPVPLLGLDCDNGTEFVNHTLRQYCRAAGIKLTRSRPYKKNDCAYVEQKNGALVRPLVGRWRYSSPPAYDQLQVLYSLVRLQSNFFQPSRRVLSKSWHEGKQRRVYGQARTPLQRMLEAEALSEEGREALLRFYRTLNPLALNRQIDTEVQRLWQLRERRRPPTTRLDPRPRLTNTNGRHQLEELVQDGREGRDGNPAVMSEEQKIG